PQVISAGRDRLYSVDRKSACARWKAGYPNFFYRHPSLRDTISNIYRHIVLVRILTASIAIESDEGDGTPASNSCDPISVGIGVGVLDQMQGFTQPFKLRCTPCRSLHRVIMQVT